MWRQIGHDALILNSSAAGEISIGRLSRGRDMEKLKKKLPTRASKY
jgi:hypothetical protein